MDVIAAFVVALVLSTLLVPVCIRYAANLGLIDDPSEARKVHVTQIPRTGGLAIAIGVFASSALWLDLNPELLGILLGGLVIVIFGLLDDLRNLPFQWKFAGQIAAALIAMCSGVMIDRMPFMGLDSAPLWMTAPVTLVFIVGAINAVNLSDGLDGLAAGNSLLSLLFIALLGLQNGHMAPAILAIAGVGGLLGFLRFNTHPASVFMGDTGSQFLGYLTVCLALYCTQSPEAAYSPLLPLLILGLPILDTLTVMVIRYSEGRHLFSPDRNHIHHQLLALNFRHYEVVAVLYLLCTVLVGMAYYLRYSADALLLGVYLLFSAAVIGTLHWGKLTGWQLRAKSREGKERRNRWLRKIHWYHHVAPVLLEWSLAILLVVMAFLFSHNFSLGAIVTWPIVLGLLVLMALAPQKRAVVTTRVTYYVTVACMIFVFAETLGSRPQLDLVLDITLGTLAVLLVLGVRMTRKADFRFDTHDYLVLLLILMAPQFLTLFAPQQEMTRLVLRFVVLAYIGEFLLARKGAGLPAMKTACLACLLILGGMS